MQKFILVAFLGGLCVCVSACSAKLNVPENASFLCTVASDCPPPLVCVTDIGVCQVPGNPCVEEAGGSFVAVAAGNECTRDDNTRGICSAGLCVESVCGDGIFDALGGVEECDDGPLNSDAGDCTSACVVATCGDGLVRVLGAVAGLESCDDGNTAPDDGCSADCRSVESGWQCPPGDPCAAICGDGQIVGTEQCDSGDPSDVGCPSCQVTPGYTCQSEPSVCAICGDGIVAGLETCDTFGESPTCNADCSTTACGDGYINRLAAEECDPESTEATFLCLQCRVSCNAALGDCNRDPADGCECAVDPTPWIIEGGGAGDSSPNQEDRALSIATLRDGRAYLLGTFAGATSTLGGANYNGAGQATFLALLGADGTPDAVARIAGGCGSTDRCAIAVDQSTNEAVVVGRMPAGGVTLPCGTSCTDPVFTSRGQNDVFVAKYDTSLNLVWSQQLGGAQDDAPGGVAVSATGDIYVGGSFCNSGSTAACDFRVGNTCVGGSNDGGACTMDGDCAGGTCGVTLTHGPDASALERRAFVAKLASDGDALWARAPGGPNAASYYNAVAATADGGVVATGHAEDDLVFGSISTGFKGLIVAKYDAAGGVGFASIKPGLHAFDGWDVVERPDGRLIVVGSFQPPIQGATSEEFESTCAGGTNGGAVCTYSNADTVCTGGGVCGGNFTERGLIAARFEPDGAFGDIDPFVVRIFDEELGAFGVAALSDNSVAIAGRFSGFTQITSDCYLGGGHMGSCGSGCPGGSCGHNISATDSSPFMVQLSPTMRVVLGDPFEPSLGSGATRAVATFQDDTKVFAGEFCVGAGGSACTVDMDIGGVDTASISNASGDAHIFVKKAPAFRMP